MTPSSPFSSSPSPSPWVANQSFNKSWAQQIEESYQLHSALALRVSSLAASAADSNFLDFNSDANTNRVSFSSSSSSSSPQHVSHRFWVVPTLQGMGIGTIIVKRIVRFVTLMFLLILKLLTEVVVLSNFPSTYMSAPCKHATVILSSFKQKPVLACIPCNTPNPYPLPKSGYGALPEFTDQTDRNLKHFISLKQDIKASF
ncbi:hypothetical protein ES332_D09G140900v1 [Gossypium tomentosum]|uniref:Uncharacterized protein n=1 Tax=Gossypium tomentosum TaxID=34277 RepID=A0A5D2JGP1_GOSTO|nr:hypothetical protein ES332_D09G140900v1 [Gossypium tomentosum]